MLRNSIFSFITTAVRLATGLVLFIVLAHVWGPRSFGVFMYPFTIASILVRLVEYGFALQVMRDVGRAPAQAPEIMGRAFGAKLILVVPTIAIAIVIVCISPPQEGFPLLLMLLLLDALANSFAQFLNIPLRAFGRFDEEARVVAAGNVVLFAVVIAVVLLGYGPVAVALSFVLSRTAYLLLSWVSYARIVGAHPLPSFQAVPLLDTLKQGFPFGVHATVGTLTMHVDTVMVQHFLGPSAVGLYQAGMRVLFGALLVSDALNSVYLSALARLSHHRAEVSRLAHRMTRHLLLLGVLAFACTVVGSHWIVHLLFGNRYEPLIPLLPLFGLLMFIRYGGVSYGTLLTLADKQMVRVMAVCVVLALGLGLNVLLIPRFGITGAIAASIISHTVFYAVYVVAARIEHGSVLIDWRSSALILMAFVALGLMFASGSLTLSARIQLGILLSVISTGVGVTRAEWERLSGILSRVFS